MGGAVGGGWLGVHLKKTCALKCLTSPIPRSSTTPAPSLSGNPRHDRPATRAPPPLDPGDSEPANLRCGEAISDHGWATSVRQTAAQCPPSTLHLTTGRTFAPDAQTTTTTDPARPASATRSGVRPRLNLYPTPQTHRTRSTSLPLHKQPHLKPRQPPRPLRVSSFSSLDTGTTLQL